MATIDRTAATALIAEQDVNEVVQEAAEQSAALSTFRTIRMGTQVARMPVLDVLPTAGFVTGDTGLKPTASAAWARKELTAEELAVVVPIPENVFDDSTFNVWNEVRPRIAEAFGAALDAAVFFGTGAPASWPDALEDGARAAGNVRSAAATGDLVEDISQTWALVEADGFDVNINYAPRSIRAALRGLRDANGQPILGLGLGTRPTYTVFGEDMTFVTNGAWEAATAGTPNTGADLIAGDRSKAILGIRQDVSYKILTEATLDEGGGSLLHLAQQDMIALRAKFRVAFQVADPTTIEGGSGAYPFAILDV